MQEEPKHARENVIDVGNCAYATVSGNVRRCEVVDVPIPLINVEFVFLSREDRMGGWLFWVVSVGDARIRTFKRVFYVLDMLWEIPFRKGIFSTCSFRLAREIFIL